MAGDVRGQTSVALPSGGLLRVIDAGLACCALEYSAATRVREAWDALGAVPVDVRSAGPGAVATDAPGPQVLVVAGTVTPALLPVVRAAVEAVGPSGVVVSFGACTASGGPYWDSYAVIPGLAAAQVRADIHVPGCPPPPSALIEALGQAVALAAERAR